MKITLEIEDSKVPFFMELMHHLKFVKVVKREERVSKMRAEVMEAVRHINEIKQGKGTSTSMKDFLDSV